MVCRTVQSISVISLVYTVVLKECNITILSHMLQISMELNRFWTQRLLDYSYQNRVRPSGIKNYALAKCLQDIIYTTVYTLIYIFICPTNT